MSKKSNSFRVWFYFRQGWGVYFAFMFAAVNTLTVTYYLAIEKYPILHDLFPSFLHYVLIAAIIGIPLLSLVGYTHYKKSPAYRAEVSAAYEANPWWRRLMVNSEITLMINLRLSEMILKSQRNEKLSKEEIDEISKLQKEFSDFTKERTFTNDKDAAWFKENFSSL